MSRHCLILYQFTTIMSLFESNLIESDRTNRDLSESNWIMSWMNRCGPTLKTRRSTSSLYKFEMGNTAAVAAFF